MKPLSLLALLLSASSVRADVPVAPNAQPYPEVRFEHRQVAEPKQQIFVARVDLSDPDVEVRVARGGPDPDGEGEFQTTLQIPSAIAERERFEVAINGDFFSARPAAPDEPRGYTVGKWGKAIGPALTDGFVWAPAAEARPVLMIDAEQKPSIAPLKDAPPQARQVIAGSHILMRGGQIEVETASSFSRTRHPRTAVGIADAGKTLILVVVDGRQPGRALGMSLTELAELMKSLGCHSALNLDGGGSTTLVLRDGQNGHLRVVNRPSDGRERAVANILGVSIRGSRRAPESAVLPAPAAAPVVPNQ